jgi:hypothetical protein
VDAGETVSTQFPMLLPFTPPPEGGVSPFPTAHVERGPSEGARSVSKGTESRHLVQHFDPSVRHASARSLNPELRRLS